MQNFKENYIHMYTDKCLGFEKINNHLLCIKYFRFFNLIVFRAVQISEMLFCMHHFITSNIHKYRIHTIRSFVAIKVHVHGKRIYVRYMIIGFT